MTNNERLADYDSLRNGFAHAQARHDAKGLCELIEFVRSEGVLYQDFVQKNTEILELLLRISLDLIKNSAFNTRYESWKFTEGVYDIVFHQVRLEEYSSGCAELYFKLSNEVLRETFHVFYAGDNRIEPYGMCVYFIQMAYGWFTDREQEFLALYNRMKTLIGEKPGDLEEPWSDRYKELNAARN